MADITSQQAVSFCTGHVRPAADKFIALYHDAKRITEEFHALELGATITDTEDPIVDGAVTDGRPVITGALVNAFMSGLAQYIATLETNENQLLNLTLKIAPNP